jgi:predicted nucleic acid-binding protein
MAARRLILVESSVWIDRLKDRSTPQTVRLRELMTGEDVAIGDLNLAEVLRGCRDDAHAARVLADLSAYEVVEIGGRDIAVAAARNYRTLRARGVTVRGVVDALIATCCIERGHALLFADRDFAPFVEHLGLVDAMAL